MGGGSSKSSSSSSQSTIDKRVANESGQVFSLDGVTLGEGSNFSITSADAEIALRSLDNSANLSAIAGEGFGRLLDSADRLFQSTHAQTSDATRVSAESQQAVRDAYANAATLKAGTIDQKTLIVAAIVGVAGLAIIARK